MLRHYYVTDDLDELEKVESELEHQGITKPQIHVLSEDDAAVENHRLHEISSVLKQDIMHSTGYGIITGIIGAILVLFLVYIMNWHETAVGWMPFVLLAFIILALCTWEGGFIGIQRPNVNFERFQDTLHKGKHILFIDVKPDQELAIASVMKTHPKIEVSCFGESTPNWIIQIQNKFDSFFKIMP